jgi:hypothetical protein
MADDMYDDESPSDAGKGQGEKESNKTALINSDICPGLKPGDTLEARVVAVHDKEYEVEYEGDMGEQNPKEESAPPPEMAGAPGGGGDMGGGGGAYE